MKVFLIGVDGQLGTDIAEYFTAKGEEVKGLVGLKDIDICDLDSSRRLVMEYRPDIVINTAAFHNVDLCEEEVAQTFRVNVEGVRNIASICGEAGIPLMHFSTDYIFDGKKGTPYIEDDCPGPLSIYGISKLGGERVVRYMLDRYYLVRLAGLYGHAGCTGKGNTNFVEAMLGLASGKKKIKVVDDQIMTPTSSKDAAEKIYELVQTGIYGLYHMTNTGSCSWFELACEIFKLAGMEVEVVPVTSAQFGAKALRPAYSVLDNANLRKAGIKDMRHWKEALREYINTR